MATGNDQLLVFDVRSGRLLVLAEGPEDWGPPEHLTFLGDTELILAVGGSLKVYDFPNQKWLEMGAFEGDPELTSVGGVDVRGKSIFVCDYSGNLRRFDWSCAGGTRLP